MAKFELKLPKMGESVAEATITNWVKNVGDTVEQDETIVEVATDKVDSEVPTEVSGKIIEILFQKDDVVQVGQTIAIIETEGGDAAQPTAAPAKEEVSVEKVEKTVTQAQETVETADFNASEKFFSPLVKNIAKEEGISIAELEAINGTGKDGRITKTDILDYVKNRGSQPAAAPAQQTSAPAQTVQPVASKAAPVSVNGQDEIVEMDRMRKMIAHHMVQSIQTSAHVQSFIEVDVTNIVNWRNKIKGEFAKREGENFTFTPIFMEAVAKAIKDFPMINICVSGNQIIKRKDINIGMAAALPTGNLIVPVVKNADRLNLVGLAKKVNELARNARDNKLKPEDIQGGTYTVTNVGTFGNVMGTPIINQPQVAILALGAIRKVPAVIETPDGDFIGIRHKMYLSHSYDHRVVDGALGGTFVRRVADYLEQFDINQTI